MRSFIKARFYIRVVIRMIVYFYPLLNSLLHLKFSRRSSRLFYIASLYIRPDSMASDITFHVCASRERAFLMPLNDLPSQYFRLDTARKRPICIERKGIGKVVGYTSGGGKNKRFLLLCSITP